MRLTAELTRSLEKSFSRWCSTVLMLRSSWAAISLVVFPAAISRGLGLVLNFTPRHSAKSTCRLFLSPSLDLLPILRRELDLGGGHVFFQMGDVGCARDRQHHGRFLQQPGKGKLHWVVVATLCFRF